MRNVSILLLLLAVYFLTEAESQSCPGGCNTCNVTACITCLPKNFLMRGACQKCPQNCSTCQLDRFLRPICDTCEAGTQKSPDMKACFTCSLLCLTCDRSPENCTSCKNGTNLTQSGTFNGVLGKTCKRPFGCNLPCLTCNSAGACSTCIDGLFLNGNMCRYCSFPCKTCTSETVCLTVQTGFRVDSSGVGIKCNPNCLDCNNTGCLKCADKFVVASLSCSPCSRPCLTCQGTTTNCTSCPVPLLLKSGTCILCSPQCLECVANSPSVCTKCHAPFSTLPSGGMCFRCTDFNCRTCIQSTRQNCIECNFGFLLTATLSCSKCPEFCSQCSPNSNSNVMECTQCSERTALTTDMKCLRCLQGCLLCSILTGTQTTCTKCADGAWNSDGNCMKCKQGCKTCENGLQCTSFADGRMSINGEVFRLRPGCKTGIVATPERCVECMTGYFLAAGDCKRCSSDCQVCSSSANCTACSSRTSLNNGACVRCNDKCMTCQSNDPNICKSCPLGTVLGNNTCAANCASVNCLQCDATNTSICTKGRNGYSVNQNNKMIRCMSSCGGKCNSKKPSECLSAAFGFELINGKSVKCPEGAITCENGKPSECEERYELKQIDGNFKCARRCPFPCGQCTENNVCTACMTNFILDAVTKKCNPDLTCGGTTCTVCPFGSYRNTNSCVVCTLNNCASCSNTECFECLQGFYLNSVNGNMTCSQCNQNCQKCRDLMTCEVCANGFLKEALNQDDSLSMIAFSPKCVKCEEPCKTCFAKASTCRSCIDGFRINGTLCISNITVGTTVIIIGNSDTFISDGLQSDHCTKLAAGAGVSENSTIPNNIVAGTRAAGRLLQTDTTTISTSISVNANQDAAAIAGLATKAMSSIYGADLLSTSVGIEAEDGSTVSSPSKMNVGLIVGVVVGGFVFLVVMVIVIYLGCKSKVAVDSGYHEAGENMVENSGGVDTFKVQIQNLN